MSILLYAVFGIVLVLASVAIILPPSITAKLRSTGAIPLGVVITVAAALLGNSYLEYSQHVALIKQSNGDWHAHLARKLEAERDGVIALTIIVLLILIARLVPLSVDHYKLQMSHHAMEKQAKSASQAFMTNLSTKELTSAPATSSNTNDVAEKAAMTKEIASLREQLTRSTKSQAALEMQARAASSAALDRITSNGGSNPLITATELQKEVNELKAELTKSKQDNVHLKTQLSDYDIVLGDARKKAL